MPIKPSPANSAARLAGLLESAMDAIVTVDEEQRIVLYNRAAEVIFGWSGEEALGQRLTKLIPERFRAGHTHHVKEFSSTGTTSRRMGGSAVVYARRANGEEFPVDAAISQLDTPEGKLFTVIMRDVTERVRAQQDLATFAAEAIAIREQEKTRVARELHDELAQSLTALKMDTIWLRDNLPLSDAGAEKLSQMLAMLDATVASTRRIAADLRPLMLDDLGLAPAIEWVVQNFTARTGVPCSLKMDEAVEFNEPYATAIFRIVQESLANVAKHARATSAKVVVEIVGGEVKVRIEDNGVGFDATRPRRQNSLGLIGVKERAHLLCGKVTVDSAPGRGTRVEVSIPIEPGAHE